MFEFQQIKRFLKEGKLSLKAAGRAADTAVERTEVRAKLADLQAETSKVEVPVSYTDDLYRLRAHIRFVAEIIDKLAGQERHERI